MSFTLYCTQNVVSILASALNARLYHAACVSPFILTLRAIYTLPLTETGDTLHRGQVDHGVAVNISHDKDRVVPRFAAHRIFLGGDVKFWEVLKPWTVKAVRGGSARRRFCLLSGRLGAQKRACGWRTTCKLLSNGQKHDNCNLKPEQLML